MMSLVSHNPGNSTWTFQLSIQRPNYTTTAAVLIYTTTAAAAAAAAWTYTTTVSYTANEMTLERNEFL